ncbi:MAG: DNA topoisomerase IB [Thermomicrobiales bacterium]
MASRSSPSTSAKQAKQTLNGNAVADARAAGPRYVTDAKPGIRRQRSGRGFRYLDANDKPVRDQATLARIKALAIPPAWTDVWISPSPSGHIQATGRDNAGRKQYRYHPAWREVRDEAKYVRLVAFGRALPAIRARVSEDMGRRDLSRDRVVAAVVRLLEETLIRVGNEEYAQANRSFGLTTLRDRHVEVNGATLHFQFRGKGGKEHAIELHDPRVARVVRRCREIPGQALFQYLDEAGERQLVDSGDVNDYLGEVAGAEFTAKDFRTWAGTLSACRAFLACEQATSKTEAERLVVGVVDEVAAHLGNTRAVCRRCYIHPAVIDAFVEGSLAAAFAADEEASDGEGPELTERERDLLNFLEKAAKASR